MIFRKNIIKKEDYSHLSKEDRLVLKILEETIKDISLVYKLQLKKGFCPKDLSKEQLKKAVKSNPQLMDPFSQIVEENGKLGIVPYHIYYAKYLTPISQKIARAASYSTNRSFKVYLEARAKSLTDGNYEQAFELWLNIKNSWIDFTLSPYQRYLDKSLLTKRTYQGYVGIIHKQYTALAEQYKEALYSSAKINFTKYHSTDIPKKGVSVFIEMISAISGYPADVLALGEHFPSNLDVARQYGARIVIYATQLGYKFDKVFYPIFKTIFEPTFASKYSRQMLLETTGWCIFLYELGEQLHKFEGARDRLQEFYAPIEKANAFASGIEHSKHLVVKGLISQEMLEAIMIIHIVWMVSDWLLYQKNPAKQSHIIGNSVLLNSYLSNGALKISIGISWPNFSRIFFEIESMAYKLTYLLQKGSYKEARDFIKKNANLECFERLSSSLSHINNSV